MVEKERLRNSKQNACIVNHGQVYAEKIVGDDWKYTVLRGTKIDKPKLAKAYFENEEIVNPRKEWSHW